jgi:5-methylcytosine-specific restriction protein A
MTRLKTIKPLRKVSGHKWQKVRKRIIARERGLCQECKRKGIVSMGTEVDHIKALQHGGTDDDDNLQLLCHDCHADKTAAEDGKRRRLEIGLDGWPVEQNS